MIHNKVKIFKGQICKVHLLYQFIKNKIRHKKKQVKNILEDQVPHKFKEEVFKFNARIK